VGGLPTKGNAAWFAEENVSLAITCFSRRPEEAFVKEKGRTKHGHILKGVFRVRVRISNRNVRANDLRQALMIAHISPQNGESVLVHCLVGLHRAPMTGAFMLASLDRVTLKVLLSTSIA
jgi:protein-tyrosine phosphatase